MALSKTGICDFGWKARDFALKGVDGKTYTLADVRGPKGTLVAFICNHCPYVKASIDRIVAEAKALREIGIGTIAIMPNDTDLPRGHVRQHEGIRGEAWLYVSLRHR
jgi:peroxiredoxin